MFNLDDIQMPKKDMAPMEEEMAEGEEMEMEEEEAGEESPLAQFSDEELMDEVKKRGLV